MSAAACRSSSSFRAVGSDNDGVANQENAMSRNLERCNWFAIVNDKVTCLMIVLVGGEPQQDPAKNGQKKKCVNTGKRKRGVKRKLGADFGKEEQQLVAEKEKYRQELFGRLFKPVGSADRQKPIQCVRTDGTSFHITVQHHESEQAALITSGVEYGPGLEDLLEEGAGNAVFVDPGVRDVSVSPQSSQYLHVLMDSYDRL